MGRRGPPKTPTALQRLRGFPGKQRRTTEPQPSRVQGPMPPPSWLDVTAKTEWRRLEPELNRLGLLTVLDRSKFAAYCAWFARWRRYEAELHTLPQDWTASRKKACPHPLVAMVKQAAEMMNRFGSQFGLSPSDRAGLSLSLDRTGPASNQPRPPPDEFDAFLSSRRASTA